MRSNFFMLLMACGMGACSSPSNTHSWPVGAAVTSCSIERVTGAAGDAVWERSVSKTNAPGPSMLEFFPADHLAVAFNDDDAVNPAIELAILSSGSLATWDERLPIRKEHLVSAIVLDSVAMRATAQWTGKSETYRTEYRCVVRQSLLVLTPAEAAKLRDLDAVLHPGFAQRLKTWLGW